MSRVVLLGLLLAIALVACELGDEPATPDEGADWDGFVEPTDATDTSASPADTALTVAPDTSLAELPSVDSTGETADSAVTQADTVAPPGPLTMAECFPHVAGIDGPDYAQFEPTLGSHCNGTDHQDIANVERVVFLGDSVTAGTPPTPVWEYYSAVATGMLLERFGLIPVDNCAAWGARTDDLLLGKKELESCFPDGGDTRRTLIIMTIGGNDLAAWAQDGLSADDALLEAQEAIDLLRDSVAWLKEPDRFPAGVDIIIANPFEYTDATGDVDSCPLAGFAGLEGNWIEGAPAVIHFHEQYMKIAVDFQIDMMFLFERFCGHGYHHDDPESVCYQGPSAELWFDLTCIHPNPTGHARIADYFISIVDE